MLNTNHWLNLTFLGLLLLISTKDAIADQSIAHVTFNPPPSNPQPNKTVIGGRRTDDKNCLQSEINKTTQLPLTALVPANKTGLTTAEYPTFWVYLPETSANQIVLSVMEQEKDNSIKHYSQTSFSIPSKSGLIALKPSDQSQPLAVGKTYKWVATLICGNKPHPNDPMIEAWVSRINLPIPNKSQNLLEKADWYGKQGIWYDFLETLTQVRQATPTNKGLITDWTAMLKSVELESLSSATSQP
jgi:hypothetical protein